jgi:hypothetical protein
MRNSHILEIVRNGNYSNRKLFIVFLATYISLLVDISISNVSDIVSPQITSIWGIILFIVIAIIYALGQHFILTLVKIKNSEVKVSTPHIHNIDLIVTLAQYILTAIIVFIVFQIVFVSYYHTILLIASVAISYAITASLMGLLAYRFFSWFKFEKSLVVLLYGLTSIMMSANAIVSIIMFDTVLLGKAAIITPTSEVVFEVGFKPGTIMSVVAQSQSATLVAFFLFTWGATGILMRHHIRRIGKTKYWVLVSLPLIYFMSYYFTFYQQLNPTNPFQAGPGLMFPIFMITYAIALCGILFGLGFRSVAGSVQDPTHVRDYMIITAIGFILFFNAEDATILQAPYPPFGLPNVLFVGLSSYLIFVGLYYSAISVANDVKLRKSIKKSTIEASKLLDSIGTAQMHNELEKRVTKITKNNSDLIEQQTGIAPSLTEDEVTQYIRDVIEETTKHKSQG